MPTLMVNQFFGAKPIFESRMLPNQNASVAINCDFEHASLRPMNAPLYLKQIDVTAKTIFKHDYDGWLTWPKTVNVLKSATPDVTGDERFGHIFLTGLEYPMQYFTGGKTFRLGMPRPTVAPSVGLVSGAGTAARNTAYCYTYVFKYANNSVEHESAPSPASDVLSVPVGNGVTVSNFVLPSNVDYKGICITHIRIYRTMSGTQSSEWHYVTELPCTYVGASGLADGQTIYFEDNTGANPTMLEVGTVLNGTWYHNSLPSSYTDEVDDVNLSIDLMDTMNWDIIPADAQGLIKTDNGIYAAFHGNELLISETFVPYAFPEGYRLTVEDKIVALAHIDGTIAVLTEGRPYMVQGSDPSALSLIHLPIEQPCMSAKSVASTAGMVIYATPDGLMMFTASDQKLITSESIARHQWQKLHPENIIADICEDKYVAFDYLSSHGFIFNIPDRTFVNIELPEEFQVVDLYHHVNEDCLYMLLRVSNEIETALYKFFAPLLDDVTADDIRRNTLETSINCDTMSGTYAQGNVKPVIFTELEDAEFVSFSGLYRFDAGEPMQYTWRSKNVWCSSKFALTCARVVGNQGEHDAIVVKLLCDEKVVATLTSVNAMTFRIPANVRGRDWAIQLEGKAKVLETRMGASVIDMETQTQQV